MQTAEPYNLFCNQEHLIHNQREDLATELNELETPINTSEVGSEIFFHSTRHLRSD